MSTDLLVGSDKIFLIFLDVIWGSLEDDSQEFVDISTLQVSKADCAFTFEFKSDGTYLRTQTLYKLFEYEGIWKFENSILTLKDNEGSGEFAYDVAKIEKGKITLKEQEEIEE
jgi:hypothetical protein